MKGLLIKGGRPLSGTVVPQGSKNAALPMIFASLLMHGTSVIKGAPDITDVRVAIEIISRLGAKCTLKKGALYINTDEVDYAPPDSRLTSRIRASSYLLGACLSRFGVAHLSSFGGCNFEHRPIDMHLFAAACLGAEVGDDSISCRRLVGGDIFFDKISVGATVNALLLSVSAVGRTRIFSYAREPHILCLIEFLRSAGAEIAVKDDCIEVIGHPLSSGHGCVIPDMIEAGTYIAAGLVTSSEISVLTDAKGEILPFLDVLSDSGASVECRDGKMSVFGKMTTPCNVITSPYPGFPTDLQPIIAPVMALFSGGAITERVWLSRFGYLKSLEKFGLRFELRGSRAEIYPSRIHSARAAAPDLRGGAALLLAAISAEGESIIENADLIYRGYESIVSKLRSIGVDIKEILLEKEQ